MLLLGAPLFVFAEVSRENRVWPIGGTAQPDPHSSAFGPRLKISEDSRYDWHRGVDLPTPLNTPLLAVDDGVVRIAGSHPSYSDGVVQIVHEWDGVTYYTNYLHVSSSLVTVDQEVSRGDQVALSGESVSGFAHLHFEVRRDGLFQRNCVNPWMELPYTDSSTSLQVSVESVQAGDNDNEYIIVVIASQPRTILDLNGVRLQIRANEDGSGQILFEKEVNFNAMTLATENWEDLDDPVQDDVTIEPASFSSTEPDRAVYTFTFDPVTFSLPESGALVRAYAFDVFENEVVTQHELAAAGSTSSTTASSTTGGTGSSSSGTTGSSSSGTTGSTTGSSSSSTSRSTSSSTSSTGGGGASSASSLALPTFVSLLGFVMFVLLHLH